MRNATPGARDRGQVRALAISIAWMLAVQLGCVVLWDTEWLTRQAALIHWLVIGVLPPALALWSAHDPAEEDADAG